MLSPTTFKLLTVYLFKEKNQVQFRSKHRLKLTDFYFRKSPLLMFFPYRGHIIGRRNPFIDLLNLGITFIFKLTGGFLGKITGWVATYEYLGSVKK